MELRYVVLTIVKILISVPGILLLVEGTLMGGHLNNTEAPPNITVTENGTKTGEEIPDPSPLVLPGYNLPENIFNKGKPFYLEKDPLTGKIDFDSKTASLKQDLYDYVDEEPTSGIFDKANIDRKDGSIGSHRPSDVNQLTPNFHDFLNLPVKYNSDKYVYPLISSSYANTKIQGNVKYYNHKDYNVKTTTHKPPSPTYYSTTKSFDEVQTTTTPKTTTIPALMNHPSFHEDFEEYYDEPENNTEVFLTTKSVDETFLTTKAPSTTTKRVMSLFEQLFGDYEETMPEMPKPPAVFTNLSSNKSENKPESEVKTEKPSFTTPAHHYPNSHAGPNIFTGSNMSYEYEDYEDTKPTTYVPSTTTAKSSTTSTTTTTTTTRTTTTTTLRPSSTTIDSDTAKPSVSIVTPTKPSTGTIKVTSLPLGENHVTNTNNHQPIILATQNLREQLNNEKVVPKPFGFDKPPSTSNVHIAPDQDMVSFVVGNHQNVEGGQYVGTSLKESPYDSNPFRPLYGPDSVSYTLQTSPIGGTSAVTIQPQKNSEASLAIGVPIPVPGQVVDELDASRVVFPDDEPPPNREVLQLNSKPMYHQLPSDLTPPNEKETPPPSRIERPRPPWDPRPGHFYAGKPEYVRPPRPPPEISLKRIDNLPNILPQFRPNMKPHGPPIYLNRQPLLDRPSNRPVGFFEKLHPPPPPKNLHNLRKIPPPVAEDRIINEPPKKSLQDHFNFFQSPPKVMLANRKIGLKGDVETLQMIQAKKMEKKEAAPEKNEGGTDKPLYVVYPVNTPPIKLDSIDTTKKESVVIGTRAELPLPPSKIDYEQNPILNPKDRNDSPVLKPHPRPTFPIKSDFPYPLERPDPSVLAPAVPETPSNNGLEEPDFSTNQWNSIEGGRPQNQISVTLRTYTDKPIAVAYTPTEPNDKYDPDKYSMPNYAGPVIPEIRPGSAEHAEKGKPDNEFTVSAVMHTRPRVELASKQKYPEEVKVQNHKSEELDFQAPFQASVNIDSMSQGWTVVRDRSKSTTEIGEEVTTLPLATTSEFDIENFKPQLIGGFKPIYSYPEENGKVKEAEVSEREE